MSKRRAKNRKDKVSVTDIIHLLSIEYGDFEWKPRHDPISELVWTILSQHTSDTNSERAFNELMSTFGSIDKVANADTVEIERAIRAGGLAKTKAPRIKAILRQLIEELGSFDLSFLRNMPLKDAKAWLTRLKGIGPKTAAIILCFSLGMPAMPVDTHIHRVSKRLGLIGHNVTADNAHDILEAKVKPDDVFIFHMYLIKHGRQVCKALRPRCDNCVLAWGCPAYTSIGDSSRV